MARADTRLWHPFAQMGAVRSRELVIVQGEGVWVWDADGNRYLDASASLWYANVGHGRTEIADAVAAQLAELEAYSTFADVANRPALELADRLSALAPMPNARVFLASGGGDGVDTAAKLARRYWNVLGEDERVELIVRQNGYHGTHGLGTSLAGMPANRTGFGPLVEHVTVVAHDSLDDLAAAIERLGAGRTAAMFLEPVIGAGGVHPPVRGYIEGVARLCAEAGVLLVVDSVICGFGRLGTWFGIERWDVQPDMVVFAKGVTSGYLPLGGVIVSERVAAPFWDAPGAPPFRHGATYAGHPACCAAALANLNLLEAEGLIPRGRELEGSLLDALTPLAASPLVAEVRGGTGLMAAVELDPAVLEVQPDAATRASALARRHGVLVRSLGTALAVSPPLTVEPEHVALVGDALARALEELEREVAAVGPEPAAA